MDLDFLGIPFLDDAQHFLFEFLHGRDSPVQALAGESRKFDFDHIEPAGRLGRVVKVEALHQGKGFVSRQVLIKGTRVMSIQVILYQTNLDGIRPGGHEFLTKLGIFFLGALRIDRRQASSRQRLYRSQ